MERILVDLNYFLDTPDEARGKKGVPNAWKGHTVMEAVRLYHLTLSCKERVALIYVVEEEGLNQTPTFHAVLFSNNIHYEQ